MNETEKQLVAERDEAREEAEQESATRINLANALIAAEARLSALTWDIEDLAETGEADGRGNSLDLARRLRALLAPRDTGYWSATVTVDARPRLQTPSPASGPSQPASPAVSHPAVETSSSAGEGLGQVVLGQVGDTLGPPYCAACERAQVLAEEWVEHAAWLVNHADRVDGNRTSMAAKCWEQAARSLRVALDQPEADES